MTLQFIDISHNKAKKLIKAITDDTVLIEEEGDVVVKVSAYEALKAETATQPIEDIIGEEVLDFTAEYFVFS